MQERAKRISPIHITLLGKLSICVGFVTVSEADNKSDKLWHLLALLVTFRSEPLSPEELAAYLWQAPPSNPTAALGNLVYRLRNMLVDHGIINADQLILARDGGYRWNNLFSCVVDTEELVRQYHIAKTTSEQSVRYKQRLESLIALYSGSFLETRRFEPWTKPFRERYRNCFLEISLSLAVRYSLEGSHLGAESVCKRSLALEHYSAELYELLIQLLFSQTYRGQALAQYRYAANLFFHRNDGSLPAALLRSRQLLLPHIGAEHLPLVHEQASEGDGCLLPYSLFQDYYRVEIRTSANLFRRLFLAAILLSPADNNFSAPVDLPDAMSSLQGVFVKHLQPRDIYAQASEYHYALLLSSTSLEHCQQRVDDLLSQFRYRYRSKDIDIRCNIQRFQTY